MNIHSRARMVLVWPSLEYLSSYKAALERGWSPDNLRLEKAIEEQLSEIERDPGAFVASRVDIEAKGNPVVLPDGSTAARLPGYDKWMWDGEFCGSIGFRWQPGTEALPPYCLGHIGYSVVPWKRQLGYATLALRGILEDAKQRGLLYVEIDTAPENIASQRVVEANGGVLIERFITPESAGGVEELRYRIFLQ